MDATRFEELNHSMTRRMATRMLIVAGITPFVGITLSDEADAEEVMCRHDGIDDHDMCESLYCGSMGTCDCWSNGSKSPKGAAYCCSGNADARNFCIPAGSGGNTDPGGSSGGPDITIINNNINNNSAQATNNNKKKRNKKRRHGRK